VSMEEDKDVECEDAECIVCMQGETPDRPFVEKWCTHSKGHKFHRACLEKWISMKTQCPLCRRDLSEFTSDEWAMAGIDYAGGTFCLKQIRAWCQSPQFPQQFLQAGRHVVLEVVKEEGWALMFAPPDFQGDREVVFEAVRQSGSALEYAADALKADRSIVLQAVVRKGVALRFAADHLRGDREIVVEAIKQSGWAFNHARGDLKADRDIALKAVRQAGSVLQYMPDTFKADREIVLEAVRQDAFALGSAAGALRADRGVVLEAVKKEGGALEYASGDLRADREVVREALKTNVFAIRWAAADMRADRAFFLDAVFRQAKGAFDATAPAERYRLLWHLSKPEGPDGPLLWPSRHPGSLGSICCLLADGLRRTRRGSELDSDENFARLAVDAYGLALRDAPPRFKRARDVVERAVRSIPEALEFAHPDLRDDSDLKALAAQVKQQRAAREAAQLQ